MSEAQLAVVPDEVDTSTTTTVEEDTKQRILHLLETFPYLSRAMIQTGLSPALPPKLWSPQLDELVAIEHVCMEEISVTTPAGRSLSKQVYHLPQFPYPPKQA